MPRVGRFVKVGSGYIDPSVVLRIQSADGGMGCRLVGPFGVEEVSGVSPDAAVEALDCRDEAKASVRSLVYALDSLRHHKGPEDRDRWEAECEKHIAALSKWAKE